MLRLGVHTVIGLVVLGVIVALAAWWLRTSYERGAAASPFVSALEKLDRGGDPAALYAALRQGLRQVSEDDAELTVFWLENRRHRGDVPALYFMASYAEEARWRDRALEYLAAARLTAAVDALACPAAGTAIERVESDLGLTPALVLLSGDADARKRSIRWALDYEETNRPRPIPRWLCGDAVAKSGPGETLERERQRLRSEFARVFAAPPAASAAQR
jgi:hypothetical protein